MDISASKVKELREITGAGMLDCKKALVECNGDIDASIDYLREKGISKAAKKADRIAAEGLANIYINGNEALVLEINSETDFVAKNQEFKDMVDTIGNALLNSEAVINICFPSPISVFTRNSTFILVPLSFLSHIRR